MVISFQLVWLIAQVVLPHFGHGAPSFDEPFRGKERVLAFAASMEHPSPQTKAAWDDEVRRLDRHVLLRNFLVLGLVLFLNGILIYHFWWPEKSPRATATALEG